MIDDVSNIWCLVTDDEGSRMITDPRYVSYILNYDGEDE